jgi:hypothetical protein
VSTTDPAPACLVALAEAEAEADPDVLPVVGTAAVDFELVLTPEPVGVAVEALIDTPRTPQIWTEIDSNAI